MITTSRAMITTDQIGYTDAYASCPIALSATSATPTTRAHSRPASTPNPVAIASTPMISHSHPQVVKFQVSRVFGPTTYQLRRSSATSPSTTLNAPTTIIMIAAKTTQPRQAV